MKKYLFRDSNNGYYASYTPFEVSGSLNQDQVNKLILSVNPMAGRTGGNIDHLLEALDKLNFAIKKYHSTYYKENENEEKYNTRLDPLPDCMYKWEILEGISGNY